MSTNTLTVRGKLTLAFGGLTAAVVLISGLAVYQLQSANERLAHFVQGVNARLLLSFEVRTAVEQRAISARNLVLVTKPEDLAQEKAMVGAAHQKVQDRLSELLKMAQAPDVAEDARRLIDNIDRVEKSYGPVALAIVDLALAGKRDEAIAKMNNDCRPLLAALIGAANDYRELAIKRSHAMVEQAESDYAMQRNLLVAGSVLSVILAVIAGLLITRSLTRALGAEPADLGAAAHRVAGGDLSPIPNVAAAATGSVLASLGEMQQSLASIVSQVRSSSDSIATGSAQIATGNTDLSQRTEEQASNLQQTSATMEELSSTVKASADTAREANEMAAHAAKAAQKGGDMVGQVVSTMHDISTASKKIADIIGVIDGIAFQTNILALNAAVEAARAGEQGRGFAVVASEVRNLAGRSAEAAKEIKSLIGASVEKVEAGTRLVNDTGESMHQIVSQVQRVSQMISELTNATVEQSQGIGQVGDAVQQLDQVTQQNAALVEETAAAAESLRVQASKLADAMGIFKVDGLAASTTSWSAPAAAPVAVKRPPLAKKPAAPAARPAAAPAPAAPANAPALAAAAAEDDWTTF